MSTCARLFLLVLLVPFALVWSAGEARADAPHESTITAAADALVRIHAVSGAVHVTGWDRHEVKVASASGVTSVTTVDGGARVSIVPSRSEAVEVWVPTGAHVEARAIGGSVTVRNIAGPLQLGTVGGDIDVSGPSRSVEAGTVSGRVELALSSADVRVTSVNGAVRVHCPGGGSAWIRTVSGALSVTGAPMSRIEMRTISGEVSLDSRLQGDGPFDVRSHSGAIRVTLPKDASFAIETHTFSGRIEDGMPDAGVGAARPLLTLSSFNGNITIDRH